MINSNNSNLSSSSSSHLISHQTVYPAITCIIGHREDIRITPITMRLITMAIEAVEVEVVVVEEEEDSTMIVIGDEAQDFNRA